MEKVRTKDGSTSFRSEKYDEHYHTLSGAKEESFEKHAKPAKLLEAAKKGKVRILDFCFGLGYNAAAAIDLIQEADENCEIEVIGLENDMEIINEIKNLDEDFSCWKMFKELTQSKDLSYEKGKIKMKVILDDALKAIDHLEGNFDAVFFDPFSPKKHPEMWTEEVFKKMFKLMRKGAVLTTYSCARITRDNMKAAGFQVLDGPCIGRRSPSTIAVKM